MAIGTGHAVYKCMQKQNRFRNLDAIVAMVKSGELMADKNGDIVLPPRWAGFTRNGHVYQTSAANEPFALLFPTEVEGDLVAGNLYCEFPPANDRWGTRWLEFSRIQGVMIHPLDETTRFREAHPYWFYAEPFYS